MFNSKFNGLLTVLLVISIIAIVGLLGYFGWSVYNKYYLNNKGANAAEEFIQDVTMPEKKDENMTGEGGPIGGVESGESIYGNTGTSSGKGNTYYGYKIVGVMSIPKIWKKDQPILEKSTIQAIKVAVGFLSGPGINKVGNSVIQGHNYRNGMFFSDLKKLNNGDKIYITGEDGKKVTYEVYKKFETTESDTSFYKRDTAGLREITLSTCTDDGKLRTIVLAKEI